MTFECLSNSAGINDGNDTDYGNGYGYGCGTDYGDGYGYGYDSTDYSDGYGSSGGGGGGGGRGGNSGGDGNGSGDLGSSSTLLLLCTDLTDLRCRIVNTLVHPVFAETL